MAYPGNLHALVARDQHLTCLNAHEYILHQENDDDTPTEKLAISDHGRRPRRKPRADIEAVARRKLGPDPSAQAFRLGGSSSQVARGGRISPCDYGKLMDHGTFEVRQALQSPAAVHEVGCRARGRDRGRDRELRVAKKLYGEALSLRKTHLRRQVLGIVDGVVSKSFGDGGVSRSAEYSELDGGATSSRAVPSPNGAQRLESYSRAKAEHLGISFMPFNPFRDEMARRARGKDARGSNATSSSGVVAGRYDISARDNDKVESLAGARAAATKSRLFRYSARWHEIAMLHRLLETGSNKQPARGTLDMIERVMRETACETASPGSISREHFISALSGMLDPCDTAALHRIYSSFDPDGTDNIRFVDMLACLLVTHKPEAEASLEGLQQTFLGNLGAISPELHSELTKGNRQVCWRFLRRLFKLFDSGAGLNLQEIERIFQLCAASDKEFLQMSKVFSLRLEELNLTHTCRKKTIIVEDVFSESFCTAFGLLDEFNTQMTNVQAIVKRTLPSN